MKMITFSEAAKRLGCRRAGRPTALATVHRYRADGLRGHKLWARRVGGIWMTSESALEEWLAAINGVPPTPPDEHSADVESELDRSGF